MSLRRALQAIPDDRSSRTAARTVVAYLESHRDETVDVQRIERGTGLTRPRVVPVLDALARAFVIDCDGDPSQASCRLSSDPLLALEVRRYLRAAGDHDQRLERGLDRFRGRYSSGA